MTDISTGKPPWQSKTLLLNGIGGLIAFVSLFWAGAAPVSEWLSTNAALIASIWAGLNVALRLLTKDKIQLGD